MFVWVLLEFLEGVPGHTEDVWGILSGLCGAFCVVCGLFKWGSHDVCFHSDKSLSLATTYTMSM